MQRINRYPADKCYPAFEQPGPGVAFLLTTLASEKLGKVNSS